MSIMVVATKYRLEQPESINKGTWKKNGTKTELNTKIVTRSFVESRNLHNNREFYIIDEDATKQMVIDREENIKAKAEKARIVAANKAGDNSANLAEAIKELAKATSGGGDKDAEIEALRIECDEKGIEYSKRAGVKKLTELLNQ